MQKTSVFTLKNPPKCLGHFFDTFLTFFQIPSRTWGINFDTIACFFELVDGQKMLHFFDFFFFSEKIKYSFQGHVSSELFQNFRSTKRRGGPAQRAPKGRALKKVQKIVQNDQKRVFCEKKYSFPGHFFL